MTGVVQLQKSIFVLTAELVSVEIGLARITLERVHFDFSLIMLVLVAS